MSLTAEEHEYVLGRLDRAHLDELAAKVRRRVALGETVEACYMPGDGTWYALLFAPLGNLAGADGGGSAGYPASRWFHGRFVVAYGQKGTVAALSERGDAELAAEALTENVASRLAIAELLRAVTA